MCTAHRTSRDMWAGGSVRTSRKYTSKVRHRLVLEHALAPNRAARVSRQTPGVLSGAAVHPVDPASAARRSSELAALRRRRTMAPRNAHRAEQGVGSQHGADRNLRRPFSCSAVHPGCSPRAARQLSGWVRIHRCARRRQAGSRASRRRCVRCTGRKHDEAERTNGVHHRHDCTTQPTTPTPIPRTVAGMMLPLAATCPRGTASRTQQRGETGDDKKGS